MQRFQSHHWGLRPKVDPDFGGLSGPSANPLVSTMHTHDPENGTVDVTSDYFSDTRVPHYGLSGRATYVCPITSEALGSIGESVSKLYRGEESRTRQTS